MACLVRLCRRNGLVQSCTNIEAITMSPPTVITRKYEDQCGCRTCCSYPNSVWAILLAQIVTTFAFALSVASIADCRLVRVPNSENGIDEFTKNVLYNGTIPVGVVNNNATSRAIGLFGWENINGECSCDSSEDAPSKTDGNAEPFSVLKIYLDFVGRDFIPLNITGAVVAALGFMVLLWMMFLLSCVAHKRHYRYILVALLIFILPLLQSMTFRILATDFCQNANCELDEGTFFAIGAIVLYVAAGLLLCIGTQDFPGNPYKQRKQLRSYFSKQSETLSYIETIGNKNQVQNGSPTVDVEMFSYNNGFADAVEIPVQSECIDRTLIEQDEIRLNRTHTTIVLTDSMNSTPAHATSDSHSIATMSPDFVKSNV